MGAQSAGYTIGDHHLVSMKNIAVKSRTGATLGKYSIRKGRPEAI
jgi:hypothetical protein